MRGKQRTEDVGESTETFKLDNKSVANVWSKHPCHKTMNDVQ
jgi:hypothetical protein